MRVTIDNGLTSFIGQYLNFGMPITKVFSKVLAWTEEIQQLCFLLAVVSDGTFLSSTFPNNCSLGVIINRLLISNK